MRAGYWLCIFFDNVTTEAEATAIISLTSQVEGIRLVVSTQPGGSEWFSEGINVRPDIYNVPDFTDSELQRFLVDGDLGAWHDIPTDVQVLVRNPLLAGIYKGISVEGRWNPENEYDLFSECFERRLVRRTHSQFPFALSSLNSAVLSFWNGERYPWSADQLQQFGLTEDHTRHLLRIGWLVRDQQDTFKVWHDRLLAWHVAEALTPKLLDGSIPMSDIAERVADIFWGRNEKPRLSLGYLPMDLIWLLSKNKDAGLRCLDELIDKIDVDDYQSRRILYGSMLPTIGSSIIPALFRRLRVVAATSHAYYHDIVNAICTPKLQATGEYAVELLDAAFPLRNAATTILSRRPSISALDKLWNRYQLLIDDRALGYECRADQPPDNLWERHAVWSALRSCVQLKPQWLEDEIASDDLGQKPVGALTHFLTVIPDGDLIWKRWKHRLRSHLRGEEKYHYAEAVRHYRDLAEIEWLISEIKSSQSDIVSALSLRTLIRIAPNLAVEHLLQLSPDKLSRWRSYVTHALWCRKPAETIKVIERELIDASANSVERVAAFSGLANAMTPKLLDAVLDRIERALTTDDDNAHTISGDCHLATEVTRLGLLECLWSRAGSALEEMLVEAITTDTTIDKSYPNVHSRWEIELLYKIGGEGYTKVINFILANGSPQARMFAIDHAAKRPDETTINLLESYIETWVAGSSASAENYQFKAHVALAEMGAWKAVVSGFLKLEEAGDPQVMSACYGQAPLSDDEMQPALDMLRVNPKHHGAIMALGFGQRTDFTHLIGQLLASEDPNEYSGVTNACLYALNTMPTIASSVVEPLIRRIAVERGQWLVLNVLVREGGPKSAKAILNHVRREFSRKVEGGFAMSHVDDMVARIRYLLTNEVTREYTLQLLQELSTNRKAQDNRTAEIIRQVLRRPEGRGVNAELAKSHLRAQAFAADGPVNHVGERFRAIRALVAFDAEEAYVAALRILKKRGHDAEFMAFLLRDIDRERSAHDLFNLVVEQPNTTHTEVFARAVARAADAAQLTEKASDKDPKVRRAAVLSLGYAFPSANVVQAVKTAMDDPDVEVYDTALEARQELCRAQWAIELKDAFLKEPDQNRRRLLLDAAVDTADLGADAEPVPQWLQDMCDTLPPLILEYVEERVKKKRKEVSEEEERKAKRHD